MAPDPFEDLRERLRATQEAAERIAGTVPPQGWATAEQRSETADEIRELVAMLHGLRDLVPDELWDQIREVVRQLLLLLRAILDLIVERLGTESSREAARRGPVVEDIPLG